MFPTVKKVATTFWLLQVLVGLMEGFWLRYRCWLPRLKKTRGHQWKLLTTFAYFLLYHQLSHIIHIGPKPPPPDFHLFQLLKNPPPPKKKHIRKKNKPKKNTTTWTFTKNYGTGSSLQKNLGLELHPFSKGPGVVDASFTSDGKVGTTRSTSDDGTAKITNGAYPNGGGFGQVESV